ncbi:hypothetical protein [Anaeromyxobacter oryzae]|nr:hypothetical protein [Anaeromyxobacter oryzae]
MERRGPWIEVPVRRVVGALLTVSGLLVVASFTGRCVEAASGCVPGSLRCLVFRAFDVQLEQNLTTRWSGALLLCAALVSLGAAVEARQGRRTQFLLWAALSVLSVVGSFDEMSSLHDRLNGPVKAVLGASAAGMRDAWIIPAAAVVTTAAVAMLPLLQDVSPRVRRLLFVSFGLFFSGALGVKAVEEILRLSGAHGTVGYAALASLEKLLELVGESLLVGAVLRHLGERGAAFHVAGGAAARELPGSPPLRIVAQR